MSDWVPGRCEHLAMDPQLPHKNCLKSDQNLKTGGGGGHRRSPGASWPARLVTSRIPGSVEDPVLTRKVESD